ncbi:MAG: ATP-binding cassette domain-containing protein [Desulfovibrionaceae bacterium]|nr:ATP-binding cassette domain-containing protein [Desulfovibrionaceae bacterium]
MPRSRPSQAPDRTRPVLSCRGVSKAFGEVRANQDIDLDLYPGRVHALVGENGAGKSTLLSILSGRLRPDSGRIEIRGRAVRQLSPARAMAAGLGMVHQRFMLVDSLSVAENLALGAKGVRSPDIRRLAKRYGLDVDPDRMVLDLSMGERQRVEILKILCRDAETLFLDEPTSVLTEPEIRSLFRVLDRLRADGRAILFVTHKLAEISGLADEVSVLRRGRMAARNLPADRDPRDLARLMFGRDTAKAPERQPPSPGRVVIEVESLSGRDSHGREAFRDVSFDLRKGEILALLGVPATARPSWSSA